MRRLNFSGFNSNDRIGTGVRDFAIQPDGKIIIAGTVRDDPAGGASPGMHLNPDGTRDGTFRIGFSPSGSLKWMQSGTQSAVFDQECRLVTAFRIPDGEPVNYVALPLSGQTASAPNGFVHVKNEDGVRCIHRVPAIIVNRGTLQTGNPGKFGSFTTAGLFSINLPASSDAR